MARRLRGSEELISRVRRDEPGAFEALYTGQAGRALRAARAVDPARAEDAVQEAFISIWQNRKRAGSPSSLDGWVTTIARRRALDLARSEARAAQRERSQEQTSAEAASAEEEYLSGADSARVAAALRALPPPQRQVIALSYLQGLSQQEIARLLHLPLGTVKGRTRLGFQSLRRRLQGTLRLPPPASKRPGTAR
jgi:RNA polymerase sigma-70 factor, ECF subfamily